MVAGRRVKDAPERDPASTLPDAVLENDFVGVYEVAQSTSPGMGQHQPTALDDFVGPVLTPNVVASILVQDERRALAGSGLPLELETHALIVAAKTLRRFRRSCRSDAGKQKGCNKKNG